MTEREAYNLARACLFASIDTDGRPLAPGARVAAFVDMFRAMDPHEIRALGSECDTPSVRAAVMIAYMERAESEADPAARAAAHDTARACVAWFAFIDVATYAAALSPADADPGTPHAELITEWLRGSDTAGIVAALATLEPPVSFRAIVGRYQPADATNQAQAAAFAWIQHAPTFEWEGVTANTLEHLDPTLRELERVWNGDRDTWIEGVPPAAHYAGARWNYSQAAHWLGDENGRQLLTALLALPTACDPGYAWSMSACDMGALVGEIPACDLRPAAWFRVFWRLGDGTAATLAEMAMERALVTGAGELPAPLCVVLPAHVPADNASRWAPALLVTSLRRRYGSVSVCRESDAHPLPYPVRLGTANTVRAIADRLSLPPDTCDAIDSSDVPGVIVDASGSRAYGGVSVDLSAIVQDDAALPMLYRRLQAYATRARTTSAAVGLPAPVVLRDPHTRPSTPPTATV